MPAPGPVQFTEQDYQRVNAQLQEAAALKLDIEKCIAAGFDFAEHDSHCQYTMQRLIQWKRTFFPDRP